MTARDNLARNGFGESNEGYKRVVVLEASGKPARRQLESAADGESDNAKLEMCFGNKEFA
jgi:hypothetical protein